MTLFCLCGQVALTLLSDAYNIIINRQNLWKNITGKEEFRIMLLSSIINNTLKIQRSYILCAQPVSNEVHLSVHSAPSEVGNYFDPHFKDGQSQAHIIN